MSNENYSPTSVGGRYAQALFDLALEAKQIDKVAGDLTAFQTLISSSPELAQLVKSPIFTADEQTRAIASVLEKAGIAGLTANFIKTVAGNRRLFSVESMIVAFAAILSHHKGEVSAEVTSASTLTNAQIEELSKALKEKLGKEPKLTLKTDASLIGGLIVKVGSKMIDTSVKSKLNSLKVAMKEVV